MWPSNKKRQIQAVKDGIRINKEYHELFGYSELENLLGSVINLLQGTDWKDYYRWQWCHFKDQKGSSCLR